MSLRARLRAGIGPVRLRFPTPTQARQVAAMAHADRLDGVRGTIGLEFGQPSDSADDAQTHEASEEGQGEQRHDTEATAHP